MLLNVYYFGCDKNFDRRIIWSEKNCFVRYGNFQVAGKIAYDLRH